MKRIKLVFLLLLLGGTASHSLEGAILKIPKFDVYQAPGIFGDSSSLTVTVSVNKFSSNLGGSIKAYTVNLGEYKKPGKGGELRIEEIPILLPNHLLISGQYSVCVDFSTTIGEACVLIDPKGNHGMRTSNLQSPHGNAAFAKMYYEVEPISSDTFRFVGNSGENYILLDVTKVLVHLDNAYPSNKIQIQVLDSNDTPFITFGDSVSGMGESLAFDHIYFDRIKNSVTNFESPVILPEKDFKLKLLLPYFDQGKRMNPGNGWEFIDALMTTQTIHLQKTEGSYVAKNTRNGNAIYFDAVKFKTCD